MIVDLSNLYMNEKSRYIFATELKKYESLFISKFKWKGLPKNVDPYFLEKQLFYFGKVIYLQEAKNYLQDVKEGTAKKEYIFFEFKYPHYISKHITDFHFVKQNINSNYFYSADRKKPSPANINELKKMPFIFDSLSQTSPYEKIKFDLSLLAHAKKVVKTNSYNLASQILMWNQIDDPKVREALDELDSENVGPVRRLPIADKKLKELKINGETFDTSKISKDNTSSVFLTIQNLENKIDETLGIFSGEVNKKGSAQESGESQINYFNKVIQILQDELRSRRACLKELRKEFPEFQRTEVDYMPWLFEKIREISNYYENQENGEKLKEEVINEQKTKQDENEEQKSDSNK